jgi:hypothetical protein
MSAACGSGTPASKLAQTPEFNPKNQTKCSVASSKAHPLIVEWPAPDRGELESQARDRGMVVVRYSGCEMQVLDRCAGPGAYAYKPLTKKKDHVSIRDVGSLYASLPMGAAKLEGRLEASGELSVAFTMVGRWESPTTSVTLRDLKGVCDGATHIVSAITVGAFTFSAGAKATAAGGASVLGAGAGASSHSEREVLSSDGDEAACEKAQATDTAPPKDCGAMWRLEVVPLATTEAQGRLQAELMAREKFEALTALEATVDKNIDKLRELIGCTAQRGEDKMLATSQRVGDEIETFHKLREQIRALRGENDQLIDTSRKPSASTGSGATFEVRWRDLAQRSAEAFDQLRRVDDRVTLLWDSLTKDDVRRAYPQCEKWMK